MAFKKTLTSDGHPIVIRTSEGEDILFPPGFTYRIGNIIYTVKKDITQDPTAVMREVSLSDGGTELMTVESIKKDLKEHDCQILPVDERFVKKAEAKVVEKVAKKKKKTAEKKKVNKKTKKNASKNSKK